MEKSSRIWCYSRTKLCLIFANHSKIWWPERMILHLGRFSFTTTFIGHFHQWQHFEVEQSIHCGSMYTCTYATIVACRGLKVNHPYSYVTHTVQCMHYIVWLCTGKSSYITLPLTSYLVTYFLVERTCRESSDHE